MENFNVLKDITERTGGDIYLGVVGPVRTGKSTFIKRFMELLVLPNILDIHDRERAQDEMPQSGAGRMVMTSEPKFIPAEAVEISLLEGIDMRVRLVDCVGYTVAGAVGFEDDEGPRMVNTPWYDEPVPFQQAAETGTRKVISEHSTIGLVVLCDNTVTDIPMENYAQASQRVIDELKEIKKPFVIVLNSLQPQSAKTNEMAAALSEEHNVKVVPLNAAQMSYDNIMEVMQEVLYEFPVTEININLPGWVEELECDHWLRQKVENMVGEAAGNVWRVRDMNGMIDSLNQENDVVKSVSLNAMELGTGSANIEFSTQDNLFNKVLGEYAGKEIEGDQTIMQVVRDFSMGYRQWAKVADAMEDVRTNGYGVVMPTMDETYLEEPELIKQGGRFGVKLCASAPSFHIIRANIATEITPLIGSEKQCEDLVRYLMDEFEDDPQKIWNTNIFGKSLNELVQEGIQSKIVRMPESAQGKLQETLQRIVNESGGGLICIIL